MWFRDKSTGASFGLNVEHCTAIFMSRVGSGMEGNAQQRITGAEKSDISAMDFASRKKCPSITSFISKVVFTKSIWS
jgi:hypothetical protein